MKIRIFIIGEEPADSVHSIEEQMHYIFSRFLAEENSVERYVSVTEATNAIASAFSDSHAVFFLAADDVFAQTKEILTKAFGLSVKVEKAILERAQKTCNTKEADDSSFAFTHAGIPENARSFVLDDGLYSGFAAVCGQQTVILLPAETERTNALLSSQVIPFINAKYRINVDMDGLKRMRTNRLLELCEKANKTIAVAGTKTAPFFMDYTSFTPELKQFVKLSPRAEKRGSMPPADYVVNLSIAAAELMGSPYGIAISNAFYNGEDEEGEKIVYMAVTNDSQTVVREIHSLHDEEISSFLERCSADLCSFLAGIIEADAGSPVQKADRKVSAKAPKAIIAVLVVILLALISFTGYFFVKNDYTLSDWYNTYIGQYFGASDSVDDNTLPDADVETSEKENI